MTILAIIKGCGREAIDACHKHGIDANFARTDIFGCAHVEIADNFSTQIAQWFAEDNKRGQGGYPIGTLLFFTKSKAEA